MKNSNRVVWRNGHRIGEGAILVADQRIAAIGICARRAIFSATGYRAIGKDLVEIIPRAKSGDTVKIKVQKLLL